MNRTIALAHKKGHTKDRCAKYIKETKHYVIGIDPENNHTSGVDNIKKGGVSNRCVFIRLSIAKGYEDSYKLCIFLSYFETVSSLSLFLLVDW